MNQEENDLLQLCQSIVDAGQFSEEDARNLPYRCAPVHVFSVVFSFSARTTSWAQITLLTSGLRRR